MHTQIPLTPIQARVLELDRAGKRPTEIAQIMGLRLARIGNVKTRLRELGHELIRFHRRSEDMPEKPVQLSPVQIPVKALVRNFCRCGLRLPCNQCLGQGPLTATASMGPGYAPVTMDGAQPVSVSSNGREMHGSRRIRPRRHAE